MIFLAAKYYLTGHISAVYAELSRFLQKSRACPVYFINQI